MFDRIKGALYGFAIGDAMGATTKFMNEEEIIHKYGKVTDIIGGGWLDLEQGQVTDDTQMTLCVCRALEESIQIRDHRKSNDMFYELCCKYFVEWFDSDPVDIGNCCRNIITTCKNKNFRDWVQTAFNPSSLGNGSLMRSMPLVLANQTIYTALNQGRLTHNNDVCDECIEEYYRLLEKCLFFDFTKCSDNLVLDNPTGHVKNSLNNAKYWLFETNSFKEAIIGAVNHGGDSDTIAAISGSMAGAYYGFNDIPDKWIYQLNSKVKKQLDHYADYFLPICEIYKMHIDERNETRFQPINGGMIHNE